MYYFNFVKRVLTDNPNGNSSAMYVDKVYHYTARWYSHTDVGEFQLYGFNGSEEDVVIFVNKNNYQKVFVMNHEGKTIDSFFASSESRDEQPKEMYSALQEVY